jgi:hypothetical protein
MNILVLLLVHFHMFHPKKCPTFPSLYESNVAMICKELLSTSVFIYHILHGHVNLLCLWGGCEILMFCTAICRFFFLCNGCSFLFRSVVP